jgi:hypothetical protein
LTEANIRRAAFQVYDYSTIAKGMGDDMDWLRVGPLTPEVAAKVNDLVKTICGNCDMTQYTADIWNKVCQLLQTFGDPA